ncbi:hypothetical protein GCM10028820_07510 [Tessaracoccus terricola]
MTLHTPVVVTDDEAVAAAARDRHWPVVRRVDAALRLTGVRQQAPLPEDRMDIASGSLSGASAAGWKFVLDWIAKHVHKPLLVTAPDSWAADLARWAGASRNWPTRFADRLDDLPSQALLEEPRHPAPSTSPRTPGTVRALVVAHDPSSQRARFWLEASRSSESVAVDLVAPVACDGATRVHVVPDFGAANLAPGTGAIDPVAALALERAAESPYDPLLTEAGSWQLALERWFEGRDDHYDVVVITGPPMAPFGFAAWAQRVWYARTVLDHSSMRADAPDPAVREQQEYWERGWNLAATVVTGPDGGVARRVVASGPGARVEVIDSHRTALDLLLALADHGRPDASPSGPEAED